MGNNTTTAQRAVSPYLTLAGAWALSFGCSVGWGAFVMPGNTFLPIAGPMGSVAGLIMGGLAMLVLGMNYHYLMNRYPDRGGTYAYAKECFGYDNGFLCAWFLLLTYVAIVWANATALPLIARTVVGGLFQFGFDYTIAGYHVYFGEMILAVGSLLIAAFICLHREASGRIQTGMAVALIVGVVVVFAAGVAHAGGLGTATAPAFAPEHGALGGAFTIFALAPWAFSGFESISHSAAEAKFDLRRSFGVFVASVVAATAAYALLVLLATTALPEGCTSWLDYVSNLGNYEGLSSQPTFFAASQAAGTVGVVVLLVAALAAIFTGLVGNIIALSRLVCALADDGLLPAWVGELDESQVPAHAILCILAISVFLPFLGRTAISWIVDVTTVGATIAYAFASACAIKTAHIQGDTRQRSVGLVGLVISILFALEFLVPNLTDVKTLATESYLILAVWSIMGFLFFSRIMRNDTERRMGRSVVAWMVLLGLVIFTSSVWMRQTVRNSIDEAAASAQESIMADDTLTVAEQEELSDEMQGSLTRVDKMVVFCTITQVTMIMGALLFLFNINSRMQAREREMEVEKALAEESSKAKTSFLSNMSHEIRTPMNAIIGLDNIALRDPDITPRTREHLEKIGASAKHLLGLINDILDMSRIESGRMVLKNEEFSFREFLDQINIIINGQCVDKGLHYECSIVGEVSDYYVGDDMKLKQVLINILGNSVKFTDAPGNVTLTVEQTAAFEGMRTLRFTMADTGVGMDEEYIPKIFEAFSQEDATTTNRYGGSGLGMAITKNFVEMMNGEILVKSKKGVGSTFTVIVTLTASSRSAHAEHGIMLPSDIRTLVVDDDEIACEHAQVVLRAIGIDAVTQTDAGEALRLVREAHDAGNPYRIVLSDYKMRPMNGIELARSIRAFDAGETAFIMLTGYNWDVIDDDAREGGVDAIMAKPLFSDSLTKTIHSVLIDKFDSEFVAPAQVVVTEEPAELVLEGKRVLMAEDVEQNAEILEDLLDLEGMVAEHAINGQRAVEMFAASPVGYYDVVLMDVRMPVKDGLTATREIRALNRADACEVPIIAMTANVFDEDVERSLQAGMDAHLSKPVEPDHLYDTMARLIAERG